jgi:cellulase
MNYMAACNGPCSSFLGDTGSPWFKISQDVYNAQTNIWASDALANNNHSYTVTIPRNIVPGQYLLRHEILALHGGGTIGGAQFYPVCIQLTVQGGGSFKPAGNVSLPGSYSPTDPGIHFSPYLGNANNAAYVAPGGGVLAGLQF